MIHQTRFDVAIIGGGPAGSTAAMFLARAGFEACIIERKPFPRETLCGEFLSREVADILDQLGLSERFRALSPNPITRFRLFLGPSRSFACELAFPAYGLKRGAFDAMLLGGARTAGVSVAQPATVHQVKRTGEGFELLVTTPEGELQIVASQVIGAYGKSAFPDRTRRPESRRPARFRFNGVKFHVPRSRFPALSGDEIQIFASQEIYCGLNAVNDDAVTLCFLERRSAGDRPPRERLIELVSTKGGFAEAAGPGFDTMLDDLPVYGAGNIDFKGRVLVRDGVFMIGDAAQVIAPVAGDGIAVAMQSGQILSKILSQGRKEGYTPEDIAGRYGGAWRGLFRRRMMLAAAVQRLLFSAAGRAASAAALTLFPSLQPRAIHYTRG